MKNYNLRLVLAALFVALIAYSMTSWNVRLAYWLGITAWTLINVWTSSGYMQKINEKLQQVFSDDVTAILEVFFVIGLTLSVGILSYLAMQEHAKVVWPGSIPPILRFVCTIFPVSVVTYTTTRMIMDGQKTLREFYDKGTGGGIKSLKRPKSNPTLPCGGFFACLRAQVRQAGYTSRMEKTAQKRFSVGARVKSTNHALRGIGIMFRSSHNFIVHVFFAALAIYLGFDLRISEAEWGILVLSMLSVLVAEMFNSAIEIDINLTSPDYHPFARDTKDVAAGAVALTVIGAGIVGLIIFLPKILA